MNSDAKPDVDAGNETRSVPEVGNISDFDVAAFEARLKARVNRVNSLLPSLLPSLPLLAKRLGEACEYALMGPGKRIRPLLVGIVFEALATPDLRRDRDESAWRIGCSYEFIHTYSLVHDDLPAMDDDDLRRGRPTTHKQFSEALAILVGDALSTYAFELIARDAPTPLLARDLVLELARAAGGDGMVGGQVADLEQESQPSSEEALRFIHTRKTGALLQSAVRCGGMLAETPAKVMKILDQYGEGVGLAFQVVDDILDVTSDEATLGKTAGKDLAQDKTTYPAVYGLARSREIADGLIAQAMSALDKLPPPADDAAQEARVLLRDLALYVCQRLR